MDQKRSLGKKKDVEGRTVVLVKHMKNNLQSLALTQ